MKTVGINALGSGDRIAMTVAGRVTFEKNVSM